MGVNPGCKQGCGEASTLRPMARDHAAWLWPVAAFVIVQVHAARGLANPPKGDASSFAERVAALRADRAASSSPEALSSLGQEAATLADPVERIDALLFAAEGLSERAGKPAEGRRFAERVLSEAEATPVDRGRAAMVVIRSLSADGEDEAAIGLARREAASAPGLAAKLAGDLRARRMLSASRWALGALAGVGALGLALEARRARLRLIARRAFDPPVLLGAALMATIPPVLARAWDNATDVMPFLRLAIGVLLVHGVVSAVRDRVGRPAAAALGASGVLVTGVWAFLASALPLPAWAQP